jgi:uncharacterized phage protein (TIGR02218 family)
MRALSEDFRAGLAAGATTLCHAWRLTRRDGAVFGFTDHDRDLDFDGVAYFATRGLAAGDGEKALAIGADAGGVLGALSSDAIDADDLARGLWDGARVDAWRVDWRAPEHRVHLFAGRIGAVRSGLSAFEAELVGLDAALDAPFGRVFSRFCDADLGDARCGVDLEDGAFRGAGVVSELLDARTFRASGLGAFADGWFTRGRITWDGGGAADIASHRVAGDHVTLELVTPTVFEIGDAFTITAGCDKRAETCRTKFANSAAFRGFPHMPGNDAILAGPDQRTPMDGGSRFR